MNARSGAHISLTLAQWPGRSGEALEPLDNANKSFVPSVVPHAVGPGHDAGADAGHRLWHLVRAVVVISALGWFVR